MAAKRKRSAAEPKLKLRPLTEEEVTFTVEIEEEDTQVRGNFVASGDDEADKADEDAIIERLDRGDTYAWCCLKVTASWQGFAGVTYLGGCSFTHGLHQPVEAQAIEMADDHGMKDEALKDLNENVQREASKCLDIINRLSVG